MSVGLGERWRETGNKVLSKGNRWAKKSGSKVC